MSESESNGVDQQQRFVPPVQLIESLRQYEDLRSSGLTRETLEAACVYIDGVGTSRYKQLAQMLGWAKYRSEGTVIVFPFFEPGALQPYGFRFKLEKPRRRPNKRDIIKYEQPSGTGIYVYFTPRAAHTDGYRDLARSVVWTEGEKKALALDQIGQVAIGLTGVDCWHDTEAKKAEQGTQLHPLIRQHVTIAGRAHVICYDADAKEKPQIMQAARKLAGVLLAGGATSVRFTCPPSMEQKGIDDYYAAHGEAAALALLNAAEPLSPLEPKRAAQTAATCKQLTAAGLDEALRIPNTYEVNDDGVWGITLDENDAEELGYVCRPVFIARVLQDLYTHEQRFEVAVLQANGRWHRVPVARAALAGQTIIAALAPFGADVDANNWKAVIRWLREFEVFNGSKLPRSICVQRTGWHRVGEHWQFMSDVAQCAPDYPAGAPRVELEVATDQARTFQALTPRAGSSVKAHAAALRAAWEASDDCAVMIAASFAAPLLRRLGLPNFAVHLCGDSSTGKTSMLKCAASVYGDPREGQDWVTSWNATAAGLEQRAAALCDLPQCYDEAGVATPEEVERAVYTLVNGTGKARSTKDLRRRETAAWHTVVLSTGERELAGEDSATGAQVRVLSLPVNGFGELDGSGVDAVRDACVAQSGAIGREWLTFCAEFDVDDLELFGTDRYTFHAELRAAVSADVLASRIGAHFALLAAVERALAEHWQIGDADGTTMRRAFVRLYGGGSNTRPLHERVLDELRAWVDGEPRAFPAVTFGADGEQTAKVADLAYVHGYRLDDGYVAFFPVTLRRKLASVDVPWTRAVTTALQRTNALRVQKKGRFVTSVRVNATRHEYYVVRLDAEIA